eukprot:335178-Karenia_brevis.AAC.1
MARRCLPPVSQRAAYVAYGEHGVDASDRAAMEGPLWRYLTHEDDEETQPEELAAAAAEAAHESAATSM